MARFNSVGAFHVGGKRYKAGTIFADTAANALVGDVVWSGMSSSTMSPLLVPLDGTATSMKAASVFNGVVVPCTITGCNSIDA